VEQLISNKVSIQDYYGFPQKVILPLIMLMMTWDLKKKNIANKLSGHLLESFNIVFYLKLIPFPYSFLYWSGAD